MKVLFLTYPRIGLNRGGLQIQIEESATGLEELGADVVRYDPWCEQISRVDVCHVFSVDCSLVYHVQRAHAVGKPVVISPVFSAFRQPLALTKVKVALAARVPGVYSDLRRARTMLQLAEKIVALNAQEMHLLAAAFGLPEHKFAVIPNGVSDTFRIADSRVFEERYGIRDFVLNVASFNENKNQLALIRSMRGLPYPLVLIGDTGPEGRSYLQQCRRDAEGQNVIFVGGLAHGDPLLASAYAAAKVFVLPSYSEVMPLTVGEAAACNCKLILSEGVPDLGVSSLDISRFQPGDVRKLCTLIDAAMRLPKNPTIRRNNGGFTSWRNACGQLYSLYETLLSRE